MLVSCVMTGTFHRAVRRSPPWATVASPGAVDMKGGSVAPPLVRHRQQALDLMTGVRQGLQKVHQSSLTRTLAHQGPAE